jgi:hypothetical protein
MALVIKKTSKTRQPLKKNTRMVTKSFDFGDSSSKKKFSRCHITYKTDGSGNAPLAVRYKIDNTSFKQFENVASSEFSNNSLLQKTNGKFKVAVFKFPKRSSGSKVSIKLFHLNTNDEVSGFELSNISFTYRGVNRR